jgi:uncharacterized protein
VRRVLPAALLAIAIPASLLAGCTADLASGGGGGDFATEGEVTVNALYAAGDTGGVSEQTISMEPSDDGDLRIDFSENEVTGFGDMTRAASWNAVTVATILTGASLDRQYRFAFDGRIDGPSAGGLTTVAVLSLLQGDALKDGVTMTGTINPTGTIGAVGGIPEKIQGVIDAGGIDTVLIPDGQRNSVDANGELVDVVDLAEDGDVEVLEVGTVYDAYEAMTGAELPAPDAGDPDLDESGYDKLDAATTEALARYDRAWSQFGGLDAGVREAAGTLPDETAAIAAQARDLQTQGLPAGAFVRAQSAAVQMEAVFNAFDTLQQVLVSGPGALVAKLEAASTTIDSFEAHIDTLGTYTPKSLTDVEALVTSYGNAFDAYSLIAFAVGVLQGAAEGDISDDPVALANSIFLPLVFLEYGRGQLEYAKSIFSVGRDNDSGEIDDPDQIQALGSYLRRGADANWAAFESGVLAPNAEKAGMSTEAFRNQLGGADLTVALAYAAQAGQAQLDEYIGEGEENAAYAAMGYGIVNYARNAVLLEKYAVNGVLDENLNLVDVQSDAILSTSLDLGREQTARALGVLEDQDVTTVITVGSYEDAGLAREGDVLEKFDAIASYSSAFLLARSLAYLGGFPGESWS